MTPQLVHRYAFPMRDAIEALLGDAAGDCLSWRIRIEGEEVVVDVVEPMAEQARPKPPPIAQTSNEAAKSYAASAAEVRGKSREEPHKHRPDAEPDFPADEQSGETSPEPRRKGGPMARRAGILCSEGGFRSFIKIKFDASPKDEDGAATWLRLYCGVRSRADLDHDPKAAAAFRQVETQYQNWLRGYE